MRIKKQAHDKKESPVEANHRAVVIGCSVAGLAVAQVLARYFAQVTIVERDRLPGEGDFRSGVPQGRQAHTLLSRGLMILEQLFPGLSAELTDAGAVSVDPARDVLLYDGPQRQPLDLADSRPYLSCSRPLLEQAMRRRVMAHPRVRLMTPYEVVELLADDEGKGVRGVHLSRRGGPTERSEVLAALVVDASGRNSHAPDWLQRLGYMPPEEWTISAFAGYTTRLYGPPPDFEGGWKTLHVRPAPPDNTRGGLIVPLEGNRWHVALVGVARDLPPVDEDEFMAFARSLPTAHLYDAISRATPLSPPYGYRITANRMRRYDKLNHYLEGFLVCGDAAYALNPVYALGMTAAVSAGQALERAFSKYDAGGDLRGLAAEFQRQLNRSVAPLWRLSTRNDWHWPLTVIDDNEDELQIEGGESNESH